MRFTASIKHTKRVINVAQPRPGRNTDSLQQAARLRIKQSRPQSQRAQGMKSWLEEDCPHGDITSLAIFKNDNTRNTALIVAREACIISGGDAAASYLSAFFPHLRHKRVIKDGKRVIKNTVIMKITGPVQDILRSERVVLNLMQHLSGVATLTHQCVQETHGTKAKILDTRKTLPGLRLWQKKAVKDGGGVNHRMSLSDAYMIKDNHIAAAGSLAKAITCVRAHQKKYPARLRPPLIVEVDTWPQFCEALAYAPNVILLDNMQPALVKKCVAARNRTRRNTLLEVSGGISLKNIRRYALTGVDRISMGALTHSAKAVDLGLEMTPAAPFKKY